MQSDGQHTRPTYTRYSIVAFLFINVVINYMDRANISLAGTALTNEFSLSPVQLGYILSAFGWTYAALQIPSGWFSDHVIPRILYTFSIIGWSFVTLLQGFANGFAMLFGLRLAVGVLEAPAYPINNRVVTNWFPDHERAFAIAFYTSGQYIGLAFLTPLMIIVQDHFGWQGLFITTGSAGIVWGLIWYLFYRDPLKHKRINEAELEYIQKGGGITDHQLGKAASKFTWHNLGVVFSYRKLWGIYLAQFAITSTLWFFLTWFPTYLQKYKGINLKNEGSLVAAIPFMAAFAGVLLSGFLSDYLVKKKVSTGIARKTPVITGLCLSAAIIGANYVTDTSMVILFMSIAFFGNGMASITWVFVSLLAPKNLIGITGGVFNLFGNLPAFIVPIIIGYLVKGGSFEPALIFIGIMAVVGICSYVFLVGKIERIYTKNSSTI